MPQSLESTACFLAYRWYLWMHLEASHQEAWNFAVTHWRDFLGKRFDQDIEESDDLEFFAMECEGASEILAEK